MLNGIKYNIGFVWNFISSKESKGKKTQVKRWNYIGVPLNLNVFKDMLQLF